MGFARTRRRNRAILGNSGAILGGDDDIAVTDPNSQFYGWTNRQINEYWAKQGVSNIVTDTVRNTIGVRAGDDVVTQSDALLRSGNDPLVAAALQRLASGSSVVTEYGMDAERAAEANREMQREIALEESARKLAGSQKFADELTSDDLQSSLDYLRGMLTRAEWIEDYKSVARGGKPNNALKFKDRIPAGAVVQQNIGNFQAVLQQIQQAGGNINLPTQLIDEASGRPIAVLQQTRTGTMVSVQDRGSDMFSRLTGFLDSVAGKISDASTQVQKINNAARGAAAGAKAGYSAPTDWKPLLLGGGALATLFLLTRKR